MNKEAAASAGDALAGSDIRSGGASRGRPHVVCTLIRPLVLENAVISEIALAPPSSRDVTELGLDDLRFHCVVSLGSRRVLCRTSKMEGKGVRAATF